MSVLEEEVERHRIEGQALQRSAQRLRADLNACKATLAQALTEQQFIVAQHIATAVHPTPPVTTTDTHVAESSPNDEARSSDHLSFLTKASDC
jgi:hypothetical protein